MTRGNRDDRDISDAVIRVPGLRKTYGDHAAVDGLDLDVQRGESFALLGPERGGQDHDGRDPRGLPPPRRRRGRVLGRRPGAADRRPGGPGSASSCSRATSAARAHACGDWSATSPATTRHPRRPDEVIGCRRPGGAGRRPGRRACPAASAAGWTSRSASSAGPSCCSSTSRRPASTRRPAGSSGGSSRPAGRAARRSCSPPTTWTRPRSWPTGSGSIAGGRLRRGRRPPAELGGRAAPRAPCAGARPTARRAGAHRRADRRRAASCRRDGEVPGLERRPAQPGGRLPRHGREPRMSTEDTPMTAVLTATGRPRLRRIAWSRAGMELRSSSGSGRRWSSSFAFPVMMLVIFARCSAGDDRRRRRSPFAQYFLAGIVADRDHARPASRRSALDRRRARGAAR